MSGITLRCRCAELVPGERQRDQGPGDGKPNGSLRCLCWGTKPRARIAGDELLGFGQIIERAREDGGPKFPFLFRRKHGEQNITETSESKKGEFADEQD